MAASWASSSPGWGARLYRAVSSCSLYLCLAVLHLLLQPALLPLLVVDALQQALHLRQRGIRHAVSRPARPAKPDIKGGYLCFQVLGLCFALLRCLQCSLQVDLRPGSAGWHWAEHSCHICEANLWRHALDGAWGHDRWASHLQASKADSSREKSYRTHRACWAA